MSRMVELDEKNARSLARVLLALLIYDLVFAQFVFLIYVFNFSFSILYYIYIIHIVVVLELMNVSFLNFCLCS
jgi:hypothetical protein